MKQGEQLAGTLLQLSHSGKVQWLMVLKGAIRTAALTLHVGEPQQ